MIIDCESCVMRDIACKDCVVSVLITSPRLAPKDQQSQTRPELSIRESLEPAVEFANEEARVIDLLASRGMIPPLRYAQNPGFEGNSQDSQALSG